MANKLCNIFTGIVFNHQPTLSEVINQAEWGSNRNIRQSGFRVDNNFNWKSVPFFSTKVKDMPRITNPKHILFDGNAVTTPKGDKVIVVLVDKEIVKQNEN